MLSYFQVPKGSKIFSIFLFRNHSIGLRLWKLINSYFTERTTSQQIVAIESGVCEKKSLYLRVGTRVGGITPAIWFYSWNNQSI